MPSIQVKEIKSYLERKYISVSNEWVGACLSWLSEQHPSQSLSVEKIKEAIYQQWLFSDLHTLASPPCLPPLLFTVTDKYTLEGCYALQINFVYDISQSAYSQLSKLTGSHNENVDVTAAPEEPLPPWEAKPTRMLVANLTDGSNTIDGFEFSPVAGLKVSLPPGTKVLVRGPVEVLSQRLLLTADNLQVLGGCAEELLAEHTQEKVLARLLHEKGALQDVPESAAPPPPTLDDDDIFLEHLDYDQLDQQVEQIYGLHDQATPLPASRQTNAIEPPDPPEDFDDDIDEDILQEHFNLQDRVELASPVVVPNRERYSLTSAPFTYLAQVQCSPESARQVTIKGFIVTLTSKLECTPRGWSILAVVTDGSASLQVALHDQLLTRFIGYTAQEVIAIKAQAQQDASLKQKISAAMNNCKKCLLNLNSLLTLQVERGKFSILEARSLEDSHLQQLLARVS